MTDSRRHGFTIIEVVVGLAITAILATLIFSSASSYFDDAKVNGTAAELKDLGTAIRKFKASVGNYPSRLSDLTTAVLSTDKTSCSTANPTIVTYGATNAGRWTNGGPFYWKTISRTGLKLELTSVPDALIRTSTNTTAGSLQIQLPAIRISQARGLNRLIDGATDADAPDGSNSGGAVQWNAPTSDLVDVTYNIPVGTSC